MAFNAGGDGYKKQLEKVQIENTRLRIKLEEVERDNRELKASIFELSYKYTMPRPASYTFIPS